ncbi:unnamed protein product, partial [Discosporangium mesarthrocarpum]
LGPRGGGGGPAASGRRNSAYASSQGTGYWLGMGGDGGRSALPPDTGGRAMSMEHATTFKAFYGRGGGGAAAAAAAAAAAVVVQGGLPSPGRQFGPCSLPYSSQPGQQQSQQPGQQQGLGSVTGGLGAYAQLVPPAVGASPGGNGANPGSSQGPAAAGTAPLQAGIPWVRSGGGLGQGVPVPGAPRARSTSPAGRTFMGSSGYPMPALPARSGLK